jgi:hypothetical protein
MDEATLEKKPPFQDLQADLASVTERMAHLDMEPMAAVL